MCYPKSKCKDIIYDSSTPSFLSKIKGPALHDFDSFSVYDNQHHLSSSSLFFMDNNNMRSGDRDIENISDGPLFLDAPLVFNELLHSSSSSQIEEQFQWFTKSPTQENNKESKQYHDSHKDYFSLTQQDGSSSMFIASSSPSDNLEESKVAVWFPSLEDISHPNGPNKSWLYPAATVSANKSFWYPECEVKPDHTLISENTSSADDEEYIRFWSPLPTDEQMNVGNDRNGRNEMIKYPI